MQCTANMAVMQLSTCAACRPWDYLKAFLLLRPPPRQAPAASIERDAESIASQRVASPRQRSLALRARDASRPVFRALAAAITLGTGASLGPEGPRSATLEQLEAVCTGAGCCMFTGAAWCCS